MNKSVPMMYLDFYSIKEYLSKKYLAVFAGFLLLFAIVMDSPAPAIGMFMVYGMFYSGYPFAAGEKVRLDVLYASLPLSQNGLILGRYLFALMVNLLTGLMSFAVCMVVSFLRRTPTDPREALLTVAACFFLYSAMEFIQFPFFFKLGYNKARLIIFIPIVMLAALVSVMQVSSEGGFAAMINTLVQWVAQNPQLLVAVLGAAWILLFAVSVRLSGYFYSKREF